METRRQNSGRVPFTVATWLISTAVAALAAFALGCGGGDDDDDNGGDDTSDGAGPLYLIATTFTAGDQDETYLVTSDTFDASTVIDPTDGAKLLGGVVPLVHDGAVFAAESSAPVIARFDVGETDRLEKGAELSFAGVGMTRIVSWHVYIASDEKGYVFDPSGSRIVVWNPSTMTLTGTEIDLSGLDRDGWVANLVFEHSGARRRGNQVVVPLSWTDQDSNSRFSTGVLVLDTETDEVVAIDENESCGESYSTVVAPSGDIYFFPPDWSSIPHYFVDEHRPTCIPILRADQDVFADGDVLDLSALGTGSAAAGAVPDGETGFFFATVDEELWDGGKGDAFWRVSHYDFETQEARDASALPVWTGQLYYVHVGDEDFIPLLRETDTGFRTTLYRVNGADEPSELFSFDASWNGAARLR